MESTPLTRWQHALDTLTQEFTQAFGSLTADQLNQKPNPQTWSIGQVLEHIIQVNETYYPIFDQLHAKTFQIPFLGKFNWTVNFFGNFIYQSVEPARKRKIKTMKIWEPTTSQVTGDIITRFSEHQRVLLEQIKRIMPFVEQGAVIHSPAGKVIVYKLEKAIDIMIAHERRHLNQALEIRQVLGIQ